MMTCNRCGKCVPFEVHTEYDHDDYGTDILQPGDHDCSIDTCTEYGVIELDDNEGAIVL